MIFISELLHSNLLKEFPVALNAFFLFSKLEAKSSPWLDNGCFYISASLSSSEGGGGMCRSLWGCGGRAPVTDNQIGALILEDLAFPLRHNNALCAALPVSQA